MSVKLIFWGGGGGIVSKICGGTGGGRVHIHTKVRGCNRLVHVTVISSSISLPTTFKPGFTAGD